MRFFQDVEGQPVRVGRDVPGVGKDVKGAGRLDGDAEAQLPEALDDELAALVVNGPHAGHVRRSFFESGDAGYLGDGAGTDEEVLLNLLDGADERLGRDQVAEPEAGHGIHLGEAVQDKGVVGVLQNGVFLALVDEAMVDFVRDDVGRKFGNRLHAGFGQ